MSSKQQPSSEQASRQSSKLSSAEGGVVFRRCFQRSKSLLVNDTNRSGQQGCQMMVKVNSTCTVCSSQRENLIVTSRELIVTRQEAQQKCRRVRILVIPDNRGCPRQQRLIISMMRAFPKEQVQKEKSRVCKNCDRPDQPYQQFDEEFPIRRLAGHRPEVQLVELHLPASFPAFYSEVPARSSPPVVL